MKQTKNTTSGNSIRKVTYLSYLRVAAFMLFISVFGVNMYSYFHRLGGDTASKFVMTPLTFSGIPVEYTRLQIQSSEKIQPFNNYSSEIQHKKDMIQKTQQFISESAEQWLASGVFGQNPEIRMEKKEVEFITNLDNPKIIRDTDVPEIGQKKDFNRRNNAQFFFQPFYSRGALQNLNFYEMADLQIVDQGTAQNSFDPVQMEAHQTHLRSVNRLGVLGGVVLANGISISSGLEAMEMNGTQTYIYDVEQQVTGTITRYIPVSGPEGSDLRFTEVREQRIERNEIQDTVRARFTHTALFIPLEIGYRSAITERLEVFGAANTSLQIRARNVVNYEAGSLPLIQNQITNVQSGGSLITFGFSAGLGYHILPKVSLRLEPSFTTFRNIGSDQKPVIRTSSNFTAVKSSIVFTL